MIGTPFQNLKHASFRLDAGSTFSLRPSRPSILKHLPLTYTRIGPFSAVRMMQQSSRPPSACLAPSSEKHHTCTYPLVHCNLRHPPSSLLSQTFCRQKLPWNPLKQKNRRGYFYHSFTPRRASRRRLLRHTSHTRSAKTGKQFSSSPCYSTTVLCVCICLPLPAKNGQAAYHTRPGTGPARSDVEPALSHYCSLYTKPNEQPSCLHAFISRGKRMT